LSEGNTSVIAVIGGTGNLGLGLAMGWAKAGYSVVIGSRDAAKAAGAAAAVRAEVGEVDVRGDQNAAAAEMAELVAVAVPFAAHEPTLLDIRDAVQGKIVIDATVPLVPPKVSRVQLPPEGSAARAAQSILGEAVSVVAAFHNIAAAHLREGAEHVDCEVLVFGDSADARARVLDLVTALGLRGWHAGPLDNAVVGEALTSTLIFINKRYKVQGAGICLTGMPNE